MTFAAAELGYYVTVFLWLTYLPVAITQLWRFIANKSFYARKELMRFKNDPFIIFQIMTCSAQEYDVVQRSIRSIHSACRSVLYSNYSVCVVTEDARDESELSELGCKVVTVRRTYETKNGAIRKARALQYAVETRRGLEQNTPHFWIYHLDEESVVTNQTVLSLLSFVQEETKLLGEGPITYPLKILKANRIAALAESIRPFHCYDCISQMANPPPVHMHGSNLLVRADVEDSVGWDHSETVAEDQLFGVKVHEQYGSIFGWHGGILLEQPPLYLRDHFRQRRRWVTGTLQNLKYLPAKMRFRIYFKVTTYWLGFLSAVASITMYTYYFLANAIGLVMHMANIEYVQPSMPSLPIATPESLALGLQRGAKFSLVWQDLISLVMGGSLLVSFGIWLLSYQIGLHQTLRNSEMKESKKALLHLEQLLLSPTIGLIETMPAFYAILKFYICPKPFRDFQVISK